MFKSTGVGSGGQGGHVPPPHFSEWGAKMFVPPPPLSDPEFRDVPPTFCHVPTPLKSICMNSRERG